MKKLLLIVLLLGISIFFVFDVQGFLTLESIKNNLRSFILVKENNPLLTGLVFLLFYALTTGALLPGATVLTLLAGAVFGLWQGALIVSFGSTLGALIAFNLSRYLLRDIVQRRFAEQLNLINAGLKKDGALYLFAMRLIPLFPFFVINTLMGLTRMRWTTYTFVTQLGTLPATIIYVNAGSQLGKLQSLSDIGSWTLWLSLALLGIFPLLAKVGMRKIKAYKVYRPWQRPTRFDRNLIVIGGGSGGLVSAYLAATLKASVTLIEAQKMGGDCLNYGCVPSKALIKTSRILHQMQRASDYGLKPVEPQVSLAEVMQRVRRIIAEIEPHDSIERYTKLGVEVLEGYAHLINPWTVEIKAADGSIQCLSARNIILATGAKPFIPPLKGLTDIDYFTSDSLWEGLEQLDEIPQNLVVLGGGPIGCELAQCFARLGSRVKQIELQPRVLLGEDIEVSEAVKQALEADGVEVLTEHKALYFERIQGQNFIIVEHAGQEQRYNFDKLICAVGRSPNIAGYGIDNLGIDVERGILVNQYMQTNYPNIYAVGDVTADYQFTHTAAHQAKYAVLNALFGRFKKFKVDYRAIPRTTFVDPEVAQVGLTEQEARRRNVKYTVTVFELDQLDRAITDSAQQGFIKVLTTPGKDKILGACIVGENAGDILAEFVLAMQQGLGLNKILNTVHSYPTFAEANRYVAGAWKSKQVTPNTLKLLRRYHDWLR